MNATLEPAPPATSAQQRAVVTIGVFDGVHRGHRALLAEARRKADGLGMSLACLTFDPHPMSVVRPEAAPKMLSSLPQRTELLRAIAVDDVRILRFDHALSQVSAKQFVHDYVAGQANAGVVVVGRNFRFGHRAQGDVGLLHDMGRQLGFLVDAIDLATHDGEAWSSTRIRALVVAGDVSRAAEGLARPHRVEGVVERGDRRGTELGFPTANVAVPDSTCQPGDGVYAARFIVDPYGSMPEVLNAAVSVGANATFGGAHPRVEAYVLDEGDWDFYDRFVAVDFVQRLRDMQRFPSVDELVTQMHADVAQARELLG